VSGIKWLACPECRYRFYIIEEHAGQGFEWFCPKCKFTFGEDESVDEATARAAQRVPTARPARNNR
jgi:hypothetical protein